MIEVSYHFTYLREVQVVWGVNGILQVECSGRPPKQVHLGRNKLCPDDRIDTQIRDLRGSTSQFDKLSKVGLK